MKLLYVLFTMVNATKIIKNIDMSSCRNCIHYKPSTFNTDFTASYNKCTKFGNKDIVTDKITYDFANSCRRDKSKCGNDAIYFEREPNLNMKILKHTIISNIPNSLLIFSIILFGIAANK
jgi:hypothetical protein